MPWLAIVGALGLALVAQAADVAGIFDIELYDSGSLGYNPNTTFRSSDIVAPVFGINKWDAEALRETSAPYLFITATEPGGHPSPYIFNATDLSLVWADTTTSRMGAMNFRPQTYRGTSYLAFWQGNNVSGRGKGTCVLYDFSYSRSHVLTTKHIGINADLHECKLTNDGTALLTAYNFMQWNLTDIGGKDDDWLMDCFFQEVDIETGDVLFSWSAIDWFDIHDSFENYNEKYDFFHLNSVEKDRNGNYLISSRHLHMIALVGGLNAEVPGKPIWILGGKRNMFEDISNGLALDFSWQHHARFQNYDDDFAEITFFDNHKANSIPGGTNCQVDCSSGKRLFLDYKKLTVQFGLAYQHPRSIQSGSMGSCQAIQSDGAKDSNILVGWGANPAITEFTSDGRVIMDIQFGPFNPGYKFGRTVSSYRAFKGDWKGYPLTDPAIATDWTQEMVYMSWNGATEVRSWAVYVGGEECEELAAVDYLKTSEKIGFETAIKVPRSKFVQIRALDSNGLTIKKSAIWDYEHNREVNGLRRCYEII